MKKLIMSLGFALATVFAVQAQEVPQEDQSSQEQTAPEAGDELQQEEVAPEEGIAPAEGETEELPADETAPAEGEVAPEEGLAPSEEETMEENPNDEVILEEQSEEANPNK